MFFLCPMYLLVNLRDLRYLHLASMTAQYREFFGADVLCRKPIYASCKAVRVLLTAAFRIYTDNTGN